MPSEFANRNLSLASLNYDLLNDICNAEVSQLPLISYDTYISRSCCMNGLNNSITSVPYFKIALVDLATFEYNEYNKLHE